MTEAEKSNRGGFSSARKQRQAAYSLFAVAIYVLGYAYLYELMGTGAGILLVVPVMLLAWLFGLRIGLLAGLGAIVVNTIHLNLVGYSGVDALFHRPGWMGSIILVAIGGLIGYLSDIRKQLRTELRRVQALQKACDKRGHHFQTVVEQARQPILIVRDGRIIWTNKATTEATGHGAQTLTSTPFLEFVHPDDRQEVRDIYMRRVAGRQVPDTYQLRVIAADGSTRWFQNSGGTIDWFGEAATMNFLTDITDRKQTEQALVLERDRLANIIEGTDAGVWEWNVQTGKTVFNSRWAEVLGYSLEALSPISIETWKALMHPEDLMEAEACLQQHFDGELEHYEQEFRMRHRDGNWVWILDRGRIITRDGDGKPLLMFGTHTDISRRKANEHALLESESRLRAITDSAQDAIVMMDPQGHISFWNPAAERIFGYSAKEALSRNLHQLLAPERYHDAHNKAFADFRSTGEGNAVDKTVELEALTKAGHEISIELSLSAIKLNDDWHAVGIMRDVTDRKEAQIRLKQALDQQDAIFESSLVGIMVLHDRTITKVNPRMAQMLGYEPHEIEGRNPEQLHLSYDNFVDFGVKYYWRLAETEIVHIEYPLRHKDGHTVWCQFNGKAIAPPDLSRGAVWIIEDMTERRAAQEAVRKSEQKLSLHVKETPLAYIELDTDFVVRDWNPAAEKTFGYSSEEAIGSSAADLIIVDSTRQHLSAVFQRILDNTGGRRSTNINRTKDGRIITCDWHNTALTDETGHVTGIACLAMDVTETKRAEEELRRSEQRFRLFFELGMIGMAIKSPDMTWIHCNERLCEMLGYTREELMQTRSTELSHPDDREASLAAYQQIATGQTDSYTLEKRFIHKSGEIVEVMVSAKCLRSSDGSLRSILALFQDITARKRAMEALAKSEAQNRAIVSALPDLMFRMRRDGTFLDFNAPEEVKLLRDRHAIIGNTLKDLDFPADYVSLVNSNVEKCLDRRRLRTFEYSMPVDDQMRHYEARVTPCGPDEVLFLVRDVTERRKAIEKIRQQADFLKSVLESIPHPFYVIDPETMHIKMANSATHEGTLPEGATCHLLTHNSETPCSGKDHPCAVKRVRENLKPYTVEHTHFDRAGYPRTVEVRAFPVLEHGNLTDIIEYSTDITERKRVEMRLAMLATFAENNPGMIVTLDSDAHLQYTNPATESNLARMGLSVEEIARVLPHNVRDLIHRCVSNSETIQGLEVRFGRNTLLWDFHPVPGQSIVHAFAEDITDRVHREQELRKLSHAINQSPTIVIITDPEGTIEYVNPHFTRVTGYSLVEAVGKKVNIVRSGRQDQAFYRELWETITAGHTWNGRIQNRRKNGEVYWQRTTISPIFGEDGKITSFLCVAEDITSEVRAQQQLMESDKLAAIGTLAAGVAHEFKNYLGGIIGNASFAIDDLQEEGGLEAARETFTQIIEMGEKANDVAMSLLTFSRTQPDDFSPEDLRKVISRSITMVEKELINQSIEIVTYLEEDIPPVEVSASRIQQILMNLFINAQHAVGSDGVVTVALVREGDLVHIKVGDTGPGIPQQNLGKIFDPFFSTKGVWGEDELAGTGMGLAIGRNIAREHGGDLTVESVEGVGSCFTLTLPLSREPGRTASPCPEKNRDIRLLLFTLNRKILSHYHPQASVERVNLMAADSREAVSENLRRVADAVICDARFCAKIELFRMAQTCMEQDVPYIMINCGQMEYQLAELFEKSRRNFKGLPALQRVLECIESKDVSPQRTTIPPTGKPKPLSTPG
jgi:PAS domain S-box-containing protein